VIEKGKWVKTSGRVRSIAYTKSSGQKVEEKATYSQGPSKIPDF
jgi:hypothetical protein